MFIKYFDITKYLNINYNQFVCFHSMIHFPKNKFTLGKEVNTSAISTDIEVLP